MKNEIFYKIAKILRKIPLKSFVSITGQSTIYPFYHAVSDKKLPHIKHLYPVRTIKDFEKDLDFFLKKYRPIEDIPEFITNIKQGNPLAGNSFLLTFDDGLREFHDIVAPILLRKGVPAICFLNSAFIDNKDIFFRFKASILLDHIMINTLSAGQKREIEKWSLEKQIDLTKDYNVLLNITYSQKCYLDEVAKILDVDFQDYLHIEKPYMNSVNIKSLINQGFCFGAHSIDHPLYNKLNIEEQLLQTSESMQAVKKQFDLDYSAFSFPFTDDGVSSHFFAVALENAVFDISFGTAGLKKDSCKRNIQRIPIENGRYSAEEIVYGEYLYYIFKSFFNKNTIQRK